MGRTNIDHEQEFNSRVYDLYSHCIHFQPRRDIINDMYQQTVLNDKRFKGMTACQRAAVRSKFDLLFHGPTRFSIYQHLEYRMLWTDGQYYAGFDAWRAKFPDGDASLIKTGEHFWKGTDRIC
jgi:hypothetical protein